MSLNRRDRLTHSAGLLCSVSWLSTRLLGWHTHLHKGVMLAGRARHHQQQPAHHRKAFAQEDGCEAQPGHLHTWIAGSLIRSRCIACVLVRALSEQASGGC